MVGSNLLRFAKNQKYLLFDFETSNLSLSSPNNKPWQLSYLLCEGDQIKERHDYFPWWDNLRLSQKAAEITRFNYSDYQSKATDPVEILENFDKYIYDSNYIVMGQNILGFDVYIHNIYRKLMGKSSNYSYINRCIDTSPIFKAYIQNIKLGESDNRLAFQYRMLNTRKKGLKSSLNTICDHFGIEYDRTKAHDGIYDATVNWLSWNKLKWAFEI